MTHPHIEAIAREICDARDLDPICWQLFIESAEAAFRVSAEIFQGLVNDEISNQGFHDSELRLAGRIEKRLHDLVSPEPEKQP